MNQSKSQTLSFGRTALLTTAFVGANIILPAIFHVYSLGGPVWLPLFFFTLVGTLIYGWRVGLVTAVVSPILSTLFTGMPVPAVLPVVLLKSVLLSLFIALFVSGTKLRRIAGFVVALIAYQVVGMLGDALINGGISGAWENVIGEWPGITVQLIAGLILIMKGK